jgi:hypothetical protein
MSRDSTSPRQVSEFREKVREPKPVRLPGPPGSVLLREKLAEVLGPNGGVFIWLGFSTLIVGALGAAYFGQRRSDRISSVINTVEQLLLKNVSLRARTGPVLAGGAYNVQVDSAGARGFYNAKTAEGVKAVVYFTGAPSASNGGAWAFSDVRVKMGDEIIDVGGDDNVIATPINTPLSPPMS